jgi:hypothetical protein
MKLLELFAGTRSISKAFERAGHETFSVEWDKQHPDIDWYTDVKEVTAAEIIKRFGKPDVIWCSPDCTSYSIAGISHHRRKEANGNLAPISEYAQFCDDVNIHVLKLIEELNPKYFFIENPRGGLRKMKFMEAVPYLYTVTYCQFGDSRMKPTDIFSNHPAPNFKPPCKNGAPCHTSAPRGSRTGTQGIKGTVDRSRIPEELCDYIVEISTKE